jgi:hypothetical protein
VRGVFSETFDDGDGTSEAEIDGAKLDAAMVSQVTKVDVLMIVTILS